MINACGNYVVVEPVYNKKIGAIYLPDGAEKREGQFYGIVVSVGPECPHDLKHGQKILYQRNEGTVIEHNGRKFLALLPARINAIVEDE